MWTLKLSDIIFASLYRNSYFFGDKQGSYLSKQNQGSNIERYRVLRNHKH